MVSQLLAFGRQQAMRPRPLGLGRLVERLGPVLRQLTGPDVDLVVQVPVDLPRVVADPAQVERVVLNLVSNAVDALDDEGRIEITGTARYLSDEEARLARLQPGRFVALEVSDTGRGMDAATRDRVFEPFFTTKAPGEGTGLGLSSVHGIVGQSGGGVRVESAPGRGTTVSVLLRAEEKAPGLEDATDRCSGRGATVLVVEDDEAVSEPLRRILEREGYRVLTAARAEEALRLRSETASPLALALVDVSLPDLGGVALAERLLSERPGLPVVLMSGWGEEVSPLSIEGRSVPVLAKPFGAERLLATLEAAMRQPVE
jgi:CheY-like chemotaxis protein